MWDELAPTLTPYDVAVLGHLFRLTAGWKRAECKISIPRLAVRCNVSENRVRKSLVVLEARGLVIRVEVDGSNRANDNRGVVFRVPLAAEATSQREGGSQAEAPSRREPASPDEGMKKIERKHEIGVYEIRTMAARLFEAHRGEPGFDHDHLRQLVRDALIGQGQTADGEVVEEAIRGMAV